MFKRMIKLPFLLPIKFYQKVISPLLPHSCRFQHSCSQYMLEAIESHGVIKGLWLGSKRLLRCHPWGGSDTTRYRRKRLPQKTIKTCIDGKYCYIRVDNKIF